MHTPDSKRAGQTKTLIFKGDVSRHCLVRAIFAHDGIWVNLKARFRVNLEVDLGGVFGMVFGVDLGCLSIDLRDVFSLRIENLENVRIPFGTETEPTKFDKK